MLYTLVLRIFDGRSRVGLLELLVLDRKLTRVSTILRGRCKDASGG